MSGYGFGKKSVGSGDGNSKTPETDIKSLDFSGIQRAPVAVDPEREEAAIQRGDALGFVDRGASTGEGGRRRRRPTQPQISVFIKGPKDTLEWFIGYTNERGHRSYWETLEEFRALTERNHK